MILIIFKKLEGYRRFRSCKVFPGILSIVALVAGTFAGPLNLRLSLSSGKAGGTATLKSQPSQEKPLNFSPVGLRDAICSRVWEKELVLQVHYVANSLFELDYMFNRGGFRRQMEITEKLKPS